MKPLVIVSETIAEEPLAWLRARARVLHVEHDDPDLPAQLAEADALVVRTYTIVNAALLAHTTSLRVIGRAGTGLDNIDLRICRGRGIEVVYAPEANTQAVVEYVVCLLCDALRPRIVLPRGTDRSGWHALRQDFVAPRQMSELTLGVLGLGRIGGRVARVAQALGFRVIYNDIVAVPPERAAGATAVPVQRLFAESDVVTIHVDGRPGNRGFVGRDLLGGMRHGAVLLNTSRGFVVDKAALADLLRTRSDVRAYLDVHDPEPPAPDEPLFARPNAVLLPHLASRTRTAMTAMSWVVRDVMAVLEGRAPRWPAPGS